MNSSHELTGKVALISGAARNMGRAFAAALAAQGADIVVHYHSNNSAADAEETARLIQDQGQRALLVQGDLAKPQVVEGIFNDILQTFGRVDIVINNAGMVIKKPLVEYSEEDFDRSFAINAKAPFLVMQQAAIHLQEGGRIIKVHHYLQPLLASMECMQDQKHLWKILLVHWLKK